MKRIITIQDISCVGKCSLTVALPIISAAGVETAVLPTAVLSTHTAFPKYSLILAVDYTLECIRKTMLDPDRRAYGVNFVEALPLLISRLS